MLFSAGLASSTHKTYQSGTKRFLCFCQKFGIQQPFPVSQQKLTYFVAFLYSEKIAPSTVKSYLSAIRYAQISLGLQAPNMSSMVQLEYVLKGLKRQAGSRRSHTRLPITPRILLQLKAAWSSQLSPFDADMLWAAATMCFFAFLRSGELVVPSDSAFDPNVHLAYGDVRADNTSSPQFLEVRIKASKTDPFRVGVAVYLGRTNCALCPVAATLRYMVSRGGSPGIFFRFEDGKPLTRDRLVARVRTAIASVVADSTNYAGHSFRIGAATTAALQGIPDSLIKTLGRWQSSAYQLYIRTPSDTLCAVSRALASQPAPRRS